MAFAGISWLDVVMVLIVVGSIAFGFRQGLIRQLSLFISGYIATVLSAQYHGVLARLLVDLFDAKNPEIARIVAFVMLLILFTVVVTWIVWTAYRETKLPTVVVLDHVGGAMLGVIIGLAAASLTLVLARYALDIPWGEGSQIRYLLHTGVLNSAFQEVFISPLPLIHALLRPWLPAGIPVLLDQ